MRKIDTFSVTYYDGDFNPTFISSGDTYEIANHKINEYVESVKMRILRKRQHEQINTTRERVEFDTLEGFFYIDKE